MAPTVSLYIPCYNGAKFLRETIEALLKQTYPSTEILIIDDGSTDESLSIAREYPARLISHQTNKGLGAARNTALCSASAEFLAGVDADTVPDTHWLERLMAAFDDESVAGAGGQLVERYTVTVADQWRKQFMVQHHGTMPQENLPLFGCNSILRVNTVRGLGGFNEQCRNSFEDVDLSTRLLGAGFKTRYVPDALCHHCRRDTLQSLADTVYRWRLPPFEQRGVFEAPKLLAAKWFLELRQSITDLHVQFEPDTCHLLFPTLYMLFNGIMCDLLECYQRSPVKAREADLRAGLALLAKALFRSETISNNVREGILGYLIKKACEHLSPITAQEAEKIIAAAKFNATCTPYDLLQHLKIGDGELTGYLVVTLGELSTVLAPPKAAMDKIEASYQSVIRDECRL